MSAAARWKWANLGGDCRGYAAIAPGDRPSWSNSSSELRVFFAAEDGADTTLLVYLPDGSWICNDDAGGTLNPMVVLDDPAAGQYDIWVGSYSRGEYVSGTVSLTERPLGPDRQSGRRPVLPAPIRPG